MSSCIEPVNCTVTLTRVSYPTQWSLCAIAYISTCVVFCVHHTTALLHRQIHAVYIHGFLSTPHHRTPPLTDSRSVRAWFSVNSTPLHSSIDRFTQCTCMVFCQLHTTALLHRQIHAVYVHGFLSTPHHRTPPSTDSRSVRTWFSVNSTPPHSSIDRFTQCTYMVFCVHHTTAPINRQIHAVYVHGFLSTPHHRTPPSTDSRSVRTWFSVYTTPPHPSIDRFTQCTCIVFCQLHTTALLHRQIHAVYVHGFLCTPHHRTPPSTDSRSVRALFSVNSTPPHSSIDRFTQCTRMVFCQLHTTAPLHRQIHAVHVHGFLSTPHHRTPPSTDSRSVRAWFSVNSTPPHPSIDRFMQCSGIASLRCIVRLINNEPW